VILFNNVIEILALADFYSSIILFVEETESSLGVALSGEKAIDSIPFFA
jgi:hypothetical protein